MAKNVTWYGRRFLAGKLRVNRKYKDRLFRFLFRDKKDLLELYNAVSGSSCTDPDMLEVVTLDDVIFMKMKNDLSFIISDQINLYEHQSTYSPNMPLRGLMYFSRQYEGLIAGQKKSLYGTTRIPLPTPEYIIFYNGKSGQPDREELFLSDSFREGRGSGCLECRALMLNINRGHNRMLMDKCSRLWEYSEFIAEVNENLDRNMSLKAAVTNAMDTCIRNGILTDILTKNKAEVLHMLLTEYDEKKHMRTLYEEGYENGEEAGFSKGEQAGYSKGERAGYSKGEQAGMQNLLEKQISRKLQHGKDIATIAAELEMEVSVVEKIVEKFSEL